MDRFTPLARPDAKELDADPYESLRALLVVEERMVADRLSHVVAAAGPRDNMARALAGIVLDTVDEKAELEGIVESWAREEVVGEVDSRGPEFRELVESLLDVKIAAELRYRHAAQHAPTEEIMHRLEALARRAAEHAAILRQLVAESG